MGKGIAGNDLYNRVMTKVFDLALLSVLTLVFSVPVITAGAAFTALYAMMMKMRKNEEGAILKGYVKEFKENLKPSIAGWIVLLAGFAILAADLVILRDLPGENGAVVYGVTVTILALYMTFVSWYLCVRARFVETFSSAAATALRFMAAFLPVSITCSLWLILLFTVVIKVPMSMMLVPVFGAACLCYPQAVMIGGKIDRYIEEREATAPMAVLEDPETLEPGDVSELVQYSKAYRDEHPDGGVKRYFYVKFDSEKRKISGLHGKERLSYLFTYYKGIPIAIVSMIVLAVLWFSGEKTAAGADFSIALVNTYGGDTDGLEQVVSSAIGGTVLVDNGYQIPYTIGEETIQSDVATLSDYDRFFLNIRTGNLDAAIVPESFFNYTCGIGGALRDVREVIDRERLAAYMEFLVWAEDEELGLGAYGIVLPGSGLREQISEGFVADNRGERAVLIFPAGVGSDEQCALLTELLME